MRICLLSREYPPDTGWGGVGTYTYHIAHGLAARGHEVHVVALAGRGKQSSDICTEFGINVHRVTWEGLLDELNLFLVTAPTLHFVMATGLAIWKRFLELHEKIRFDAVEAPEHLAAGFFNATTGVAPLVIKLHTPHSKFVADNLHMVAPDFDNQMVCVFENMAISTADVLCSPSEDMSRFVAGATGVSVDRIVTSRNPVDTVRFSPDGAKFKQFGGPTALLVGRLEERKGVTYFIDAVPSVVSEVPTAHFVVCGADTNTAPGGGSMLAHLQTKLKEAGCLEHVTFLSHVNIEQMPDIYRSADICVIPSLYDNAPYSCIEAMSCGLPVVVSDAGGTKEYASEGEWGFVFPKGDVVALGRAISCLLKDSGLRQRFSVAARSYVANNLSREVIANQMEHLYVQATEKWSVKSALYQKPPSQSLPAAVQLACSFDSALFSAMSKQSMDFRLRHSFRFAAKRPRLFAASLALAALRSVQKLSSSERLASLIQRLEHSIAGKQNGRYESTMAALLEPMSSDQGKLVASNNPR